MMQMTGGRQQSDSDLSNAVNQKFTTNDTLRRYKTLGSGVLAKSRGLASWSDRMESTLVRLHVQRPCLSHSVFAAWKIGPPTTLLDYHPALHPH